MKAGFGKAVITPELPVILAGFGSRKGAVDEIHDDLEALAVVFEDEGQTVCLLVLDLLLLGPDFADPLRARVAAQLGIAVDDVMTSCTHTHSGPAATKSAKRAGWPVPDGYFERLAAACCAAAQEAKDSAVAAKLSYAMGPLPEGLSLNRRGHAYAPSFAVLDVTTTRGRRICSISNIAIHPVAAGDGARAVSRDWPGAFRDAMSAATGAPSVMLSGAIGDINPGFDPHASPEAGGKWESMTELGQSVASAAQDLLAAAAPIESQLRRAGVRTPSFRAGLTIPTLLSRNVWQKVDVPLLEWQLGDVRLVSLPGEAFHQLGVEVSGARDDRVLMAAISPHWCGYLPCPYTRGYEEAMSFGKRFTALVRAALLEAPSID